MKRTLFVSAAIFSLCSFAATSEISVDIKMDELSYVSGEKVRGIVDIRNQSPNFVAVGYADAKDLFLIEVFRFDESEQLEKTTKGAFVASFYIKSNEGQRLETFLADHYDLTQPGRYLVRPVLIHNGIRYEGSYRSFDIVPGMEIKGAVQMFANRPGLSRIFTLKHWSRKGKEHLFLTAQDEGYGDRTWQTTDIGPMMRITPPTISIMSTGQVIVIHRNGADSFVRSEFWSLPDALNFRSRQMVRDPETAGQQRVQEMYMQSGGVEPVERPWWKIW